MTEKSYKITSRIIEAKREAIENQYPEETRTITQQECITDLLECEKELKALYQTWQELTLETHE